MRALISVADKSAIVPFAQALHELGWELISTGGTAAILDAAGLPVTPVTEITGFPEILGGRVKTLHPAIHAAILARREQEDDLATLAAYGITPIDLVAVNLYPFAQAVQQGAVLEAALEQIDIGGPALLRAAAKNFPSVLPVVDPSDYPMLLSFLRQGSPRAVPFAVRRGLAAKAFAHVACYDSVIAHYLGEELETFPRELPIGLAKVEELRYGENPGQSAALYHLYSPSYPVSSPFVTIQGKALSYNNVLDALAAWLAVQEFDEPAAVIVKHANPCGAATASTLLDAYTKAFAGDPISAFGGIVALNQEVDRETAQALTEQFYEVIVAPSFASSAHEILSKRSTLRLLQATPLRRPKLSIRTIGSTVLVQKPDRIADDITQWHVVTKRAPTAEEWRSLQFAWRVVRHLWSNAIVLAQGTATVGLCGGQPNRVDAVRFAVWRAGERAAGSVLASDGFFPFADNIEVAAQAGITAVVQPGGSRRDTEVIEAADAAGIAMVFTNQRVFRH